MRAAVTHSFGAPHHELFHVKEVWQRTVDSDR
jgi:hypothetical protein